MNTQLQRRDRFPRSVRSGLLACGLSLAIANPAWADAVTDWNATFDAAAPAFGAPPQRAYLGAMVQIAVHDALNSIDRRYETYDVVPTANPNASPDAAIATAAHSVLINQLSRAPDSATKIAARANVEAAYTAAMLAIPAGTARNLGIAAGQAAADAIFARRANDGSATQNLPYTLAPGPGVYQSTAPNFPVAANAGWALVTPFAMTSNAQFLAPPSEIFNLRSAVYARDYNEVKSVGNAVARAAAPDSEPSRIARFFPGGGADWTAVTRVIAASRALDRWQHARLFALLEIAEADGAISAFDTKYTYNFWRPVTAIHWANDGNPATMSDPAWLPYLVTPPYPDYSCALPTVAGAATEVLRRYFGTDNVPYSLTVSIPQPPLPPESLTRSYVSLSQASAEAVDARV
ncbi:MAG: vanadium-dependent haloperoxidase, partial [Luteimonas sp.]